MPYDLPLPKSLRKLWKIKVQDKEALYEQAHVTIWRRGVKWRWGLPRRGFLDPQPDSDAVPEEVLALIDKNYDELCR